MRDVKIIAIGIVTVLVTLILCITVTTNRNNYLAAEMVKGGADPLAISCLMGGRYENTCLVVAMKDKQP